MRPGPLPRPAVGWAASASRAGHAGLQFFGASALDAYRPGRLFPPQGSARRSRRSIARCCCGSSRMWCYGLSPPIKLLTFALCESNEVVLGACPRISIIGLCILVWHVDLCVQMRSCLCHDLDAARPLRLLSTTTF